MIIRVGTWYVAHHLISNALAPAFNLGPIVLAGERHDEVQSLAASAAQKPATAVADFSVRARPGAPVALPLEWHELKSFKAQFSVSDVMRRIRRRPPALERYQIRQSMPG